MRRKREEGVNEEEEGGGREAKGRDMCAVGGKRRRGIE